MKKVTLKRNRFTFYAPCLTAVEQLPKSRRYEALLGILRCGLYGEEVPLTGAAGGAFEAIRPSPDSGRSKAAARLEREGRGTDLGLSAAPGGRM